MLKSKYLFTVLQVRIQKLGKRIGSMKKEEYGKG